MKKWLALPVFFILIFFDQVTKYLAQIYLKEQENLVLIDGVFELCYLENRGAAFGIMQNRGIFFIAVTILFMFFSVWFYVRLLKNKKFRCLRYLILLIAAGAAGNMIDRMFRGYVVDFFYFSLINFPIFNVADCYVTLAVACLIVLIFFCFSEEDLEELALWKKH